jgi:hypothetical protein
LEALEPGGGRSRPAYLGEEESMKLLEQLKAKGIARVVITFDGSGDSGYIEGVHCYDENDKEVKAGKLEEALFKLGDAIIERDYDVIDFNNEGCFGEIRIDVESGEIEIDVNTRYIEYHTDYKEASVQDYLKEETV